MNAAAVAATVSQKTENSRSVRPLQFPTRRNRIFSLPPSLYIYSYTVHSRTLYLRRTPLSPRARAKNPIIARRHAGEDIPTSHILIGAHVSTRWGDPHQPSFRIRIYEAFHVNCPSARRASPKSYYF